MMTKLFYFLKTVVYIGVFALLFVVFLTFYDSFYKGRGVRIELNGGNMGGVPIEVFYTNAAGEDFSPAKTQHIVNDTIKDTYSFNGTVPLNTSNICDLRVDFGGAEGGTVYVKKLIYKDNNGFFKPEGEDYGNAEINDVELASAGGNEITVKVTGEDPFIVFRNKPLRPYNEIPGAIISAAASLAACLFLNRFVRIKSIYAHIVDFYTDRKLIMNLALNDFKTKYAGSYFGIVWAFVQPVCTILVFWFVFQVGFRSADIGNVPFILWFSSGLIPWFFFSDAWNSSANAFIEYSYLVKKIVFKINILPLVKIISALFVHLFFVVFMALIFIGYGYYPNIFWVQIIYYMFCMIILVLGLGMLTAPLMVFFRDLGQVMGIVLQFGMWLTPIMWDINRIPPQYQWPFKLNPMYYIVQGYRDSMLNGVWFYDNIKQTLYFWAATLVIVFVGSLIYRRLKPHFADVL